MFRLLSSLLLISAAWGQFGEPTGDIRKGANLPATCNPGNVFNRTGLTNPGLYDCPATNNWRLVAIGGNFTARGVYVGGTTYDALDLVSYNGVSYVSTAGSNTGHTPDVSPTWWAIPGPQGAVGATGPTGPTGAAGATGATGAKGDKGDTGAQGPPGSGGGGGTLTDFATTKTSGTVITVSGGNFRYGTNFISLTGPITFTIQTVAVSSIATGLPTTINTSTPMTNLQDGQAINVALSGTGAGCAAGTGVFVATAVTTSQFLINADTTAGCTLSSGTVGAAGGGTAIIFGNSAGQIEMSHSAAMGALISASGVGAVVSQTSTGAFPNGSVPSATATIAAGAFDTVTDNRAWLTGMQVQSGPGIDVTMVGGQAQVGVASNVPLTDQPSVWLNFPDFHMATKTLPWRTGTGSPNARDNCANKGEAYFQTDTPTLWTCTTTGNPGVWTAGVTGGSTTVNGQTCTIGSTCTVADSTKVPTTTTVNGHALSGNVSVTATDVSLGSVTNDVQTKAAIVPNTAPSAGQILAGNAGGTAYAPVSISGSCSMTSTGVMTCPGSLQPYVSGTFSSSTHATITAATHGFSTKGLAVMVYDTSGNLLAPDGNSGNPITVNPSTYDVDVYFASATTFIVAINGGVGQKGNAGADGTNGAGYTAASSTSLATGTGSKTLTTQTGLAYVVKSCIQVVSAGTPGDFMLGSVTAYNSSTGSLTFTSTARTAGVCSGTVGSGTHTDWVLSIAGVAGADGANGAGAGLSWNGTIMTWN